MRRRPRPLAGELNFLDSPLGESGRLATRFRRHLEEAALQRKLARIAAESSESLPAARGARTQREEAALLRGIPVVGVPGGAGGAVADSRPGVGRDLDAWPGAYPKRGT